MAFQYNFGNPIKNLYNLQVYLEKQGFSLTHINFDGTTLTVFSNNSLTTEQQTNLQQHITTFQTTQDTLPVEETSINKASIYNSFSGSLDPSETFHGAYEDIRNYSSLTITCFSDSISSQHGLHIHFSTDGINHIYTKEYTVYPNQLLIDIVTIAFPYYKVSYHNSDLETAQVSLQTVAHLYKQPDPNSKTIRNEIYIKEEEPMHGYKTTNGYFRSEGFKLTCPPGDATHIFKWEYPVSCNILKLITKPDNIGDIINTYIGKDTIIGTVRIEYTANSEYMSVCKNCLVYLKEGFLVKVNGHNFGEVLDINKETATIKISIPYGSTLPALSFVQMTTHNLKNFYLIQEGIIDIGGSKIGSSYIPANTEISLVYTNTSQSTKDFYFIAEYNY
jgi:hypothetical protein